MSEKDVIGRIFKCNVEGVKEGQENWRLNALGILKQAWGWSGMFYTSASLYSAWRSAWISTVSTQGR